LGSDLTLIYLHFRHPCVALNIADGKVRISSCSCPQQADGRCSHVAALLYLIEHLSLNISPKIFVACTSRQQTWGTGLHHAKEPKMIQNADYQKSTFKGSTLLHFDPRPENLRATSEGEIDAFIDDLGKMSEKSMWHDVLSVQYEDFVLKDDRLAILEDLSAQLWNNLASDISSAPVDKFSNDNAVHFGQTIAQAASNDWHSLRQLRVTASVFYEFVKNPVTMTRKMLWEEKPDLSQIVAIKWGLENEARAISDFEHNHGKVDKVGLFVSKTIPFLGASPDGLWNGCVVEVKCPFVMQKLHPTQIEKLLPNQRRNFFCNKKTDKLCLKKSHKYYYQVQLQLFVTGLKLAKFIV
jgi:hypothetical protein